MRTAKGGYSAGEGIYSGYYTNATAVEWILKITVHTFLSFFEN